MSTHHRQFSSIYTSKEIRAADEADEAREGMGGACRNWARGCNSFTFEGHELCPGCEKQKEDQRTGSALSHEERAAVPELVSQEAAQYDEWRRSLASDARAADCFVRGLMFAVSKYEHGIKKIIITEWIFEFCHRHNIETTLLIFTLRNHF